MPITLVSPIEIVQKQSVLVNSYDISNVFINFGSDPYIRVTFIAKDSSGNDVEEIEALLNGSDFSTSLSSDVAFFTSLKNQVLKIGKGLNIFPNNAGVS